MATTGKVKKVDTKKLAKESLSKVIVEALSQTDFEFTPGEDYEFKTNSIVVHGVNGHDVRIDFTTPKAGKENYDDVLQKVLASEDEDTETTAE